MNFLDVLKFVIAALIPVALSVGCIYLEKTKRFSQIDKNIKSLIFGVIFGISSISGTLLGLRIPNGAIINVRDASPIICGLLFGGPSGIIAGFIGGGFRALTPLWDAGTAYTVVACSISTAMAGVFTALIRHFIFNDKKGTWYYGFFLGILVEDFHMMMSVITHISDLVDVYNNVIKVCTFPMMLANSLAVMLAIIIVNIINHEKIFEKSKIMHISTKVQLSLICSLVVSYVATSVFTNVSVNKVVQTNINRQCENAISDVINNVDDTVNKVMQDKLDEVATKLIDEIKPLEKDKSVRKEALINILNDSSGEISEINIVGTDGFVHYSTDQYDDMEDGSGPFDMQIGEQSRAFNVLLTEGETNYFIQEYREISAYDGGKSMKYAGYRFKASDIESDFCYFQIGLDANRYHELLKDHVYECAKFRHIGEDGFVVVSDANGGIVSTISDCPFTESIDKNKFLNDGYDDYYTFSKFVEGYYIVAFAGADENDSASIISFAAISLAEVFVFLLLYCVLYVAVKRKIVDNIETIGNSLKQISSGNLSVKVNQRDSFEFDSLSENINKTVDTLKDFITKEANKNAEELKFAKDIQYSVLPSSFPINEKFEIYASMATAKTVGGDFYDFYYIDREHMLIEIADVSGKGIPAAMFMMRTKTLLKSLIQSGMDLEAAFIEANNRLCEGNDTQTFITVWAGIVDLTNGHVEFINAGHNPPLVSRDGKFEYLRSKAGFVLAGLEGFKYQKQNFDIKPGDIIYLYTDGVTEANNIDRELYGETRLVEEIGRASASKTVCETVTKNLKKFVKDAEQSDDITMLAFKLSDVEDASIKVVDADIQNLPVILDYIDELLDKNNATISAKSQIDVAVDEMFSNIAFYAYPKGLSGKVKVSVIMSKDNEEMTIIFEDRGKPFDPLKKADPNTSLSLEEKSIGGLGIFIVKKTMDFVGYENVNGHNILTLKKKIH